MVEEEELRTARAAQQGAPTGAADPSGPRASSAPPWKGAARYPVEEEEVDEPEEHAQPFPVRQKPENTRTIEIEHFVPRVQLDPAFFEKPYFVTTRDQVGQEAYAVIRDAMRRKEMIGIGYVMPSSRKRPIALEPLENGIRGITLRHIENMRSPAEYFIDIPELQLPPEMLEVAEHIVGTKARLLDHLTICQCRSSCFSTNVMQLGRSRVSVLKEGRSQMGSARLVNRYTRRSRGPKQMRTHANSQSKPRCVCNASREPTIRHRLTCV